MASISSTEMSNRYSTSTHVYYVAFVVWHCWQQHKFFLVNLPNHVLVSCKPGPQQTDTGKNQVVLGLVIWQAMWCTVILLRFIMQGTVRLRICEQCRQTVVEPHLVGKLFHQGWGTVYSCNISRYVFAVTVFSAKKKKKKIGTNNSVKHDPTQNVQFRGIPLLYNYDTPIFRPPHATLVLPHPRSSSS